MTDRLTRIDERLRERALKKAAKDIEDAEAAFRQALIALGVNQNDVRARIGGSDISLYGALIAFRSAMVEAALAPAYEALRDEFIAKVDALPAPERP